MQPEPWPSEAFEFLDDDALGQLAMDAFTTLMERHVKKLDEMNERLWNLTGTPAVTMPKRLR